MPDMRTAILRGRREAGRLHREFGMRERIKQHGGRIDVFETIVGCGVPLLFKPLDGLLGVFMDEPIAGVLVTTKRGLSVQRFTGAHELGHFRLGHHPSLDDESMLTRLPFSAAPNEQQQEVEANAFATEFMMPPWLFAAHFMRQGWAPQTMADPMIVYQLSLRIGASYEATCRSLMRPGVRVIDRPTLDGLLRVEPREIKRALLAHHEPPDWRRDVWILTAKDEGSFIQGSRSDLFVLKLKEHSGAGYVWTFDEINETGFVVVKDEREAADDETIGGDVTRLITAQSAMPQYGQITLAERRPWIEDASPLEAFCVHYDLTGPEEEGLSHAERRLLLEAA